MTRLKAAILPTLLMVSFTATALEGEKKVDFAARVVAVQGQVLSRPEANKKATPHALKTGDKLYPGDVINTGSDSRLKLLLADWSVIDLGPSTLFKIGEMTNPNGKTGARNVKLGMKYGTIRAAVNRKLEKKSKFQVRTPSATMGVRGTEFVVKAENAFMKSGVEGPKSGGPVSLGKTEVIVTKGKVGVALQSQGRGPSAQQKTFAVTAGKSFTATTGSAGGASSPKVSNVSQTQMTSAVSSASMKDNTFMSAVSVEASSDEKKEGSSNSDDSDSKSGKSKSKSDTSSTASALGGATFDEVASALDDAIDSVGDDILDMGIQDFKDLVPATMNPDNISRGPENDPTVGQEAQVKVRFN